MTSKLREPHILLLGNPVKLLRNLSPHLGKQSIQKINKEVRRNIVNLYKLGESHHRFARTLNDGQWRQIISRLYYGAYNARRAVALANDGSFSTESSDHQSIGLLPDSFPQRERYATQLKVLREDRNLCDYGHIATISDLVLPPKDALDLVNDFMRDAKSFLLSKGVKI